MVPFRLNQQQFALRYAQCLERLSSAAIAALRAHLDLAVQDGVTHAEAEVFVGEDDPYVPSIWIYYLGPNNRVDSGDMGLFAGRSLELSLGLEGLEEFDARFFTSEKFGGLPIVAGALTRWFAEMWWKAGGWDYRIPTTLTVHDGIGEGKPVKLTER